MAAQTAIIPHVYEMTVSNFRGIASESFPLAPLTIIVGPNNAGKSSIAAALALGYQSKFWSLAGHEPAWTSSLADLGSFEDAVHRHVSGRRIRIGASFSSRPFRSKRQNKALDYRVEFELKSGADPVGLLSQLTVVDSLSGTTITADRARGSKANYTLSASGTPYSGRWKPLDTFDGSRDWYQREAFYCFMDAAREARLGSRASRGKKLNKSALKRLEKAAEHAWMFGRYDRGYRRIASARPGPERIYPRTAVDTREEPYWRSVEPDVYPALLSKSARELKAAVDQPIKDLLREIGVAQDVRIRHLSAYHSIIETKNPKTGVWSNLSDTGYGISQVIPVLSALASKERSALHIEQPEAHLHPRAQAALGSLFVRSCRTRQLLVETHSVHVINRVRLHVAQGELDSSMVSILYVSQSKSGTQVTPIGLSSKAAFSREWPDGFFDERSIETLRILKAAK